MKVFHKIGHGIVRLGMSGLVGMLVGCSSVQSNDPVNPKHPYVFPGQAEASPSAPPVISKPASVSTPAPLVSTPAPMISAPAVSTPPLAVAATPAEVQPTPQVQPMPVAPQPQPVVNSSPALPETKPTVPIPSTLAAAAAVAANSMVLQPGDNLIVSFSDLPANYSLPPVQVELGADGKITLHNNVQVYALGKTPRQLEQEIRTEYVPKIYKYLTVTIRTEVRWFHVNGEVKQPNQIPWRGQMTVLKAIAAAQGFTDWAKITKVQLTRVNGQKFTINCKEAQEKPDKDLPVYPGDIINVPRKGFLGF